MTSDGLLQILARIWDLPSALQDLPQNRESSPLVFAGNKPALELKYLQSWSKIGMMFLKSLGTS